MSASSVVRALRARLPREVDIAWLAAFRFLFGLTMAVSLLRFIAYGWIDSFFVSPRFHFRYFGFEWVEPLPGWAMHGLFYALTILAFALALGLFFRVAAFAFALGFAYLQLVDVATYLNHYYLATLLAFLLACSPAGRAGSLDVRLGRVAPASHVAFGWLALFRLQVGVVYTFAGLAKATPDWLLHAQPLGIWLSSRTGLPILGPWFAHPWAAPVMSWCGFLFDTTIVWFLLARRTRPFAYAAVLTFHALTRVLFPIGMFPWIMVLAALVFFSPSWPRRLLAALRLDRPAGNIAVAPFPSGVARAAFVLYAVLQVVVPLRFLAYGGNVLWHEQGMRFSWRVMVREKNGSVTFRVTDPTTGRTHHVNPRDYLTRIQVRELSGQPDLILQLAHHVRREFEARLGHPVEVRVDARVSLNGRRSVPLIDPHVDLGATKDGLARKDWILAAPEGPPPALRIPPTLAKSP